MSVDFSVKLFLATVLTIEHLIAALNSVLSIVH